MWKGFKTFYLDLNKVSSPWEKEISTFIKGRYTESITAEWWPSRFVENLFILITLGWASTHTFWINFGASTITYNPFRNMLIVSIPWTHKVEDQHISSFDDLPITVDKIINRLDLAATRLYSRRKRSLQVLGLQHKLLPGPAQPGDLSLVDNSTKEGAVTLSEDRKHSYNCVCELCLY